MGVGRRIQAGCCVCAARVGLAGEVSTAILLDVSDCLRHKPPGICTEQRAQAVVPEHSHFSTEMGTPNSNRAPLLVSGDSAVTSSPFQWGFRAL